MSSEFDLLPEEGLFELPAVVPADFGTFASGTRPEFDGLESPEALVEVPGVSLVFIAGDEDFCLVDASSREVRGAGESLTATSTDFDVVVDFFFDADVLCGPPAGLSSSADPAVVEFISLVAVDSSGSVMVSVELRSG